MKIKMLTNMASANGAAQSGQTIELEDGEAVELIRAGYAVAVKSASVETAIIAPAETTELPAQKTAGKAGKLKKAKAE